MQSVNLPIEVATEINDTLNSYFRGIISGSEATQQITLILTKAPDWELFQAEADPL